MKLALILPLAMALVTAAISPVFAQTPGLPAPPFPPGPPQLYTRTPDVMRWWFDDIQSMPLTYTRADGVDLTGDQRPDCLVLADETLYLIYAPAFEPTFSSLGRSG